MKREARQMNRNIPFPSLAERSCGGCDGECAASCFNDAIVYEQERGYRVIEDNCAGCGACVPACEPGFISVDSGVATIESQLTA